MLNYCLTVVSLQWIDDIGGVDNLGSKLLKLKKDDELPVFTPPEVMPKSQYSTQLLKLTFTLVSTCEFMVIFLISFYILMLIFYFTLSLLSLCNHVYIPPAIYSSQVVQTTEPASLQVFHSWCWCMYMQGHMRSLMCFSFHLSCYIDFQLMQKDSYDISDCSI